MDSLVEPKRFMDIKDPCAVFDGTRYHIFGTGASKQGLSVAHFAAPSIDGPWTEEEPALLIGISGLAVCAPGVVFDEGMFHMLVQTDFASLHGTIEYLTSRDGKVFTRVSTALASMPGDEAGIYDPHPASINSAEGCYFTYTAMPRVAHGDIYLAKSASGTWAGPWARMGRILGHEQVAHHNPHDWPDYEWGLEGSQIVQLPDGRYLLNAVCFLPGAPRGKKQRVFFALSDTIAGPYLSLGPVLQPSEQGWDSAENGHASLLLKDGLLHLFYQARGLKSPWRYGMLPLDPVELRPVAEVQSSALVSDD